MDESTIFKRRINRNLTNIKSTLSTDVTSILDRLLEKDIISTENKDNICSIANPFERIDEVLRIVRVRGKRAFDIFMDILLVIGHQQLHDDIMKTSITDPIKGSANRQDQSSAGGNEVLLAMQTMQNEMKKRFDNQEEKIEDHFKINQEKIVEEFRKSNEKISEKLRVNDEERDQLLKENKKMAAELSFVREEITSLKKEVEENVHFKQQLNVVFQKYEKLCKENARMPDLDNENKTLKNKNALLNSEIKSLKDSLSRLRGTIKARYTPVSKLPSIVKK